jgi:hypothetical protein
MCKRIFLECFISKIILQVNKILKSACLNPKCYLRLKYSITEPLSWAEKFFKQNKHLKNCYFYAFIKIVATVWLRLKWNGLTENAPLKIVQYYLGSALSGMKHLILFCFA